MNQLLPVHLIERATTFYEREENMIHCRKIFLLFLFLLLISFEADGLNKNLIESQGDYLGQSKPGSTPEIFAPGIVSTQYGDFAGTFSPDFTEFYFTRRGGSLQFNTILVSKKIGNQWTAPKVAPFSGTYADLEPHITPDGKMLLFGSNRPFEGSGAPIDFHEWYLEKTDSGWSEPILLGAPFVDRFVMYPTVTNDGTIYFTGQEGFNYYIYLSRLVEGVYQEPEKLPVEINEMGVTAHPYIAPDESYLIFDAHASGDSKTHLFISFRNNDGSWTRLKNMGAIINDGDNQAIASVSPDGEYFFFTKNADIYWMDAAIIQQLKSEPTLIDEPPTGHAPLEDKFGADWLNSPKEFILYSNYPNPFNATTMISFDLMRNSLVQLTVYSINGERVKTLVNGASVAGHHEVLWDGANDQGQKVSSGLYLYKFEAEKNHQAKKMLYLR